MTLPDFKTLQARCDAISARYADANGFTRDDVWFLLKLQEEMGEVTQAFVKATGRGRAHGKSQGELDHRVLPKRSPISSASVALLRTQ